MKSKKHICKNCRLFNSAENVCSVNVILADGEFYELPVKPTDRCHWEKMEKEIGAEGIIQQTRMWSDGKDGYIETTGGFQQR